MDPNRGSRKQYSGDIAFGIPFTPANDKNVVAKTSNTKRRFLEAEYNDPFTWYLSMFSMLNCIKMF